MPLYSKKKHLKAILNSSAKHLSLYGSDIEFYGYRELAATPASPQALIAFLQELNKYNIRTISPTQIPEKEWPKEAAFIGSGSWSPDKSFRIWTDSEDNREFHRRANEIYAILARNNWNKNLLEKVEPFLRIFENSDPRGWAPIPERKHEANTALDKIVEILTNATK